MAICGVICEYDPFHLGHEKQFSAIRQKLGTETVIVCLMSGNFTQRGMPAVFDKTVRAKAAVLCGADLVMELPVTAVLQSAEGFASAGVQILTALGADYLSFGCECGDAERLIKAAALTLRPDFDAALREEMESGCSYAAARQRTVTALGGDGSLLERPNDILALEYCRAILKQKSPLRPLAMLRRGDYHAETADEEEPSATAVRALLKQGGEWRRFVPAAAAAVYAGATKYDLSCGERAALARLRAMTDAEWASVPHGSEGLWSKTMKAARQEGSVEEILAAAKSKRYPQTRLQRLLLCAYLGISAEDLKQPIPYVRALGFDAAGQAALKAAKKRGSIPVVNAGERPENGEYYALECRAGRLFDLFAEPDRNNAPCFEENCRIFQKKF